MNDISKEVYILELGVKGFITKMNWSSNSPIRQYEISYQSNDPIYSNHIPGIYIGYIYKTYTCFGNGFIFLPELEEAPAPHVTDYERAQTKLLDISAVITQEDADKLIEAWSPKTISPTELDAKMGPSLCAHSWKSYEGIYEFYDFCEICDMKRESQDGL